VAIDPAELRVRVKNQLNLIDIENLAAGGKWRVGETEEILFIVADVQKTR
jgi:hypothetical protein